MASLSSITSRRKTDWSKRCLCQEDKKNEGLTSPFASLHHDPEHDGYKALKRATVPGDWWNASHLWPSKAGWRHRQKQHYDKMWLSITLVAESCLTMQNLLMQDNNDLQSKVIHHRNINLNSVAGVMIMKHFLWYSGTCARAPASHDFEFQHHS